MSDFTQVAGRYQLERGISVRALARAVPCDPTHMSRVLRGHKPPSDMLARRLDEYFGAGGEITAAAQSSRPDSALDPDSRDRIGYAAAHPARVDSAAVDALEGVLAAQRRLEDRVGSAGVLDPVLAQLTSIREMVREAHGPVRPRLVHVAGQWEQFAGWLNVNMGNHAAGEDRLAQALRLAIEAGEPNLISEALSFQGHAEWVAGNPGPFIGLSQAARRDPSAYPGQLAIAEMQEAKGHAMTGDPGAVARLVAQSGEDAERARERPCDAPDWLYYHSPGFFSLQEGLAWRYLADDPVYAAKASTALAAGRAQLGDVDRNSEWGAEFLVYAADVHARGGEVDEACADAMRAVPIARQTSSPRLTGMLRKLSGGLARRWPEDAGVRELREALR